jgi:hypothetical protein
MRPWLYIVNSALDYHNFMSFFEEIEDKQSIIYIIVDGVLHCTDGRFFGEENKNSLVLFFHTHFSDPLIHMKKKKIIDPSFLIGLFELSEKEINLSLERNCILKKGKSFIYKEDVKEFLEKYNFAKI